MHKQNFEDPSQNPNPSQTKENKYDPLKIPEKKASNDLKDQIKSHSPRVINEKTNPFEVVEISSNLSDSVNNDHSLSLSDSESIKNCENLGQIKKNNEEMKTAVRQSINIFRSASNDLVSSPLNSNRLSSSIIFELENLKKSIVGVFDEQKVNKVDPAENEKTDIEELQLIYNKISKIQEEINTAGQQLVKAEEEIRQADKENFLLKEKISEIIGIRTPSLATDSDTRKQGCGCLLI